MAIGTAARPEVMATNPRYQELLATEFNMVTPENVMKWPTIHPAPDRYDFSAADSLVSFAAAHHMLVRGHNLLTGGNNTADWVVKGQYSRQAFSAIVHDHIAAVVSHFRGQVVQWDVVNEALDFSGHLEDNLWLERMGSDYVDSAFRWAHQADPQALLFYNEDDVACDVCNGDFPYNVEQHRDNAIFDLVAGMKRRGVPIDGVGIQMHLWPSPPKASDLAAFMARLRGLGLQVAITEMDVRLADGRAQQDVGRQAEVYAEILRTCLAAPNCKTFVMWGFTDAVSWVPTYLSGFGHADIFDADYRPKPAYDALHTVLQGS
jgi:endo-1,4-beta-xylanase